MARLVPIAACLLLLAVVSITSQGPPAAPAEDALRAELIATAERIVLPERCGECHASEFDVWEGTEHATGFDTLHRRDRAKEIYRSLDLRVIKRGTDEATPACLSCHYTPVLRRGQLRAGAGVTCESCHGPAGDWISIHNSYGVVEADFQRATLLETAGHRAQRIADSRAAGMRRPSDLYDVAANCFGCHTVPNEELVNRGGHSTGSDFEMVAWSERIRHNFLESYKTADGRTNAERPRAWKRTMYVVGRALDLEYGLRGVAVATDPDELYLAAMSDRAVAALDELVAIDDRVALPAVQRIMAIWNAVDVLGDDGDRLRAAADAVRESTKAVHRRRRGRDPDRARSAVGSGGPGVGAAGAVDRGLRRADCPVATGGGRQRDFAVDRAGAPARGVDAHPEYRSAVRRRCAAGLRGAAGRCAGGRPAARGYLAAATDRDAPAAAVARAAGPCLREGAVRALPQQPGAMVAQGPAFRRREAVPRERAAEPRDRGGVRRGRRRHRAR